MSLKPESEGSPGRNLYARELDEPFGQWRNRTQGKIRYLLVMHLNKKVRHGGHVIDNAVLIVYGIDDSAESA